MGSPSTIFPLMAATTPFNEEKPLRCQVPSTATPTSVTSTSFLKVDGLLKNPDFLHFYQNCKHTYSYAKCIVNSITGFN